MKKKERKIIGEIEAKIEGRQWHSWVCSQYIADNNMT